ncbi:ribonuclease-3 [Motilibacter rhizosphaerae]|uniref:Ribonuclease 3 n=1 Tax=Motilibacter rhizosphaerae TaxID=598652 RepID=A0A4Q7NPI9_9ACTN|nr:ribonuclease III [Motilibacter rhizosphaerae]RZS87002.1 ribonuclease-3 [Motilibacter rhizosphaerae]
MAPAAGPDATRPGPSHPRELAERLGVDYTGATLERALTHRSYAYEHGGLPTNERLEFLGDAVLGLVVTSTLYERHPDLPEGRLAKLRAAVVNMRALADLGRALDVGAHLRLGRGEESTGGRDKSSILADTIEALIGAAYVDVGLDEAAALVHRLVDPLLDSAAELGAGLDWKTSLQELAAAQGRGAPHYALTSDGPDHAKTFVAVVSVDAEPFGTGTGRSKKEAEQEAAAQAWAALRALDGAADAAGTAADAAADGAALPTAG